MNFYRRFVAPVLFYPVPIIVVGGILLVGMIWAFI